MKKVLSLVLALVMVLGMVSVASAASIDKLTVMFVPSRNPEDIMNMTEPLAGLLKEELAKEGIEVEKVEVSVSTSYEAAGEALSAGTIDVALIPGGTYVMYDDGADVILTATRAGLSKDFPDAKDWNDGEPTNTVEEQVTYYRAVIIAGPSEKGAAVSAKVNAGEELTWDDMNGLTWSVMGPTSSAGYIYPSLWLQSNFDKGITDLNSAVVSDSYGTAFARLATGDCDVLVVYADGRRDYEEKWNGEWGRTESIWKETNIIGVTEGIYNDTVSKSKNSETMTDEVTAAVQKAFMNMGTSEIGQQVIAIYSHTGYQIAQSSDYDGARAAQKLLQEMSE